MPFGTDSPPGYQTTVEQRVGAPAHMGGCIAGPKPHILPDMRYPLYTRRAAVTPTTIAAMNPTAIDFTVFPNSHQSRSTPRIKPRATPRDRPIHHPTQQHPR